MLELELSDMEGLEDPNLVDYIRTFGRRGNWAIPANHSFLPFHSALFLPTLSSQITNYVAARYRQ